jgi:hypothetical protein
VQRGALQGVTECHINIFDRTAIKTRENIAGDFLDLISALFIA